MSRFQAKTNTVLDAELDELRRRLGLRANQKADLLRELTSLASWVVRQAAEGRSVVARGASDVRELNHPAIERIGRHLERGGDSLVRLELDEEETRRLVEILGRGFDPSPELLACLQRLGDPKRKAPEIAWSDAPA